MRFIELFAGIGGFRYGLEKVGFKCIWANEIDKYACKIYRKHFGGKELFEGDIRTVDALSIPDHDLLCAGFPCQAFSIAGKRGGFEDTRGTLFFEIARIAFVKRPKLLLLENVKGLLSHDNGNTFGTILSTLSDLGYFCEWQVLNSKDFGVPQNRERVFIVGHLGGGSRGTVFPIAENNEQNIKQLIEGGQGYRVYSAEGVSSTLASQAGGVGAKTGLYVVKRTPLKFLQRNQVNIEGDYAFTVDGANTGGVFISGK